LSKYADDTTLLVPQHCDVHLADELEHVIKWSKANKLKLNLGKTKEIVFRRSSLKRDILPLALDAVVAPGVTPTGGHRSPIGGLR